MSAIIYAAFVAVVTLPSDIADLSRRERAAYCVGVLAALFVPVSGAPPMGLPTAPFWPLAAASVVMSGGGAPRFEFCAALAAMLAASDAISASVGTPGARASVEAAIMAFRLAPRIAPLMWGAMFASCAACLGALSRLTRCSRSTAFAFATFAALSLAPVDASACAPSTVSARVIEMFAVEAIACAIYFGVISGHITTER